LKKFFAGIKKVLIALGPYRGIFKAILVFFYAAALRAATNYGRYKKRCYETMLEYRPELEGRGRAQRKTYRDVLYCRFMYGTLPKEYFIYRFDLLSHEGRMTFVTRSNKYKFYNKFNNKNYAEFLNKKTETYRKFGEFYGREVLCVYDEDDLAAFCAFVRRHPRYIYKPAQDYGGRGIKIYDSALYDSTEDLFRIMLHGGACVLEELIVQGAEIAQFHPQSVNTVRIVTYRSEEGETYIQWCFLRMGGGGSHTDNMSAGGISALIDPETGVICDCGRDYKGDRYIYHPDTGVQFPGFNMPRWDEVRELVKKLSAVLPQVRFVGWDLAYTDKGWLFVEGNAQPQCVAPQITSYNGRLHNYREMLAIYEREQAEKGAAK